MGDKVDAESESDVDMADAGAAVNTSNNAGQSAAQQVAQVALAAAVPNPRQHGNNNEHANPGHAPQQQQPPAPAMGGAVPGGGAGGGAGAHALPPGAGAAAAAIIASGTGADSDPDEDADAVTTVGPVAHPMAPVALGDEEVVWQGDSVPAPDAEAASPLAAAPVGGTVPAVDEAQADQVMYLPGDNPYQQMLVARLCMGESQIAIHCDSKGCDSPVLLLLRATPPCPPLHRAPRRSCRRRCF